MLLIIYKNTCFYYILLEIFANIRYNDIATAKYHIHAVLSLQHNTDYVVKALTAFFIVFKVSISFYLSVFYALRRWRLYIFSLYLYSNDRGYRRVLRYLYLCYKTSLQTDVVNYAEKPFRALLPRPCTDFSYRARR